MSRKPGHKLSLKQFVSGFTKLSPAIDKDLTLKFSNSGDTGHSGDIFGIL